MEATATLDELLTSTDGYAAMLEIAVRLAEKAARDSEDRLSLAERTLRLSMWVECQVCNGGWEQWLANTSAGGIALTLPAIAHVGCPEVLAQAQAALELTSISPALETEESKEQKLAQLSESVREKLSALDTAFYASTEFFVAQCRAYAVAHREAIAC